jgi:hypothetical protein
MTDNTNAAHRQHETEIETSDAGMEVAFIVSDHPEGEFVFRPGKYAVSRCKK